MKRISVLLIAVTLVVITVLAGCAKPSQVPAPAPAPAPTPAPAPAPAPQPPAAGIPVMPDWAAKLKTVYGEPNPYWGLGFKPDGTPYEFGMVMVDLSNEAWLTFGRLPEAQLKASGANVTMTQSGFDVAAQYAAMEDQVAKKMDAILLDPLDGAGIAPAVDLAEGNNIPVFVIDNPTTSENCTFLVLMDNIKKGVMAGQSMVEVAERMNQHLYVLELTCNLSFEICVQRSNGFHDGLEGSPLVTVVQTIDAKSADEVALNAVLDSLPSNPEINAIYTGGGLIDGTVRALKTLDRYYPIGDPKHVVYVATDDFPIATTGLREGIIDACPIAGCQEMPDIQVKAALTYACLGQPIVEELIPPTIAITPENLDHPDYGAPYRWGDMMANFPDFADWPILDTAAIGMPTPTYAQLLELRGS